MTIISILNTKGGCGKTTVSINLTRGLHERGYSTLLVDSDLQGSARDWHETDPENPISVVGLDRPDGLRKTVNKLKNEYDFIIIDGASKVEKMLGAIVVVSDFIVIPLRPSQFDLSPIEELASIIDSRRVITDGSPGAAFLITQSVANSTLGSEVLEALEAYEFPILSNQIAQRQIYAQSCSDGQTIYDVYNRKAKNEVEGMVTEILEILEK